MPVALHLGYLIRPGSPRSRWSLVMTKIKLVARDDKGVRSSPGRTRRSDCFRGSKINRPYCLTGSPAFAEDDILSCHCERDISLQRLLFPAQSSFLSVTGHKKTVGETNGFFLLSKLTLPAAGSKELSGFRIKFQTRLAQRFI